MPITSPAVQVPAAAPAAASVAAYNAFVANALAAQTQRSTVSWQRQKMDFIAAVNPDCTSAGRLEPRLQTFPTHGRVESTPSTEFIEFPLGNPRVNCNERRVPGIVGSYTSEPGYHGPDTFTFFYLSPFGQRVTTFRRVTVK